MSDKTMKTSENNGENHDTMKKGHEEPTTEQLESKSEEAKVKQLDQENADDTETVAQPPSDTSNLESTNSQMSDVKNSSEPTEQTTPEKNSHASIEKDPNVQSSIPSAIAEVAAHEFQQFQMITGQSPILSNRQPQSATVTPLFSKSGLGLLASQYDSSEDEDDDSSSSSSDGTDSVESVREVCQLQAIDGTYRNTVIEINSDSDSDSPNESDVEFVKETVELEQMIEGDAAEDDDFTGSKQKGPMRVKGEFLLDDLPPIHELYITVAENECSELGKVHSIVEQLVLVDSIPGTAALDLDTVLFLDKGQKVLGEVFDVLGQVSSPLYCVRFNSNKQIQEKEISVGQPVYIAPRTEHTHFIILKDMMQLRGSDASWENDIEPSEKHLDYSDDEQERSARRSQRNRNRDDEEGETSKRDRPSQSPAPAPQRNESFHPRNHQTRYQHPRPQRFRHNAPAGEFRNNCFQHPNYYPPQAPAGPYPPPFAYGPMNASWHTNFSQPPPYPFAYAAPMPTTMQFIPAPDAMQQPLFPPPPPNPQ